MLTETCALNYCQDGLQVYFATETQQSMDNLWTINGHYELQPNEVNGRSYFKTGSYGFWWDQKAYWWIGEDRYKGQSIGFAYYDKDVFCPHQLSEWEWGLFDGTNWYSAGNDLRITCKYIFIKNNTTSEFSYQKRYFFMAL